MPSKERLIRSDIPEFSFVENGVEINNESIFRPRLGGGGGCGNDCGVLIDGYESANSANAGVFYYNHANNTYTQISGITYQSSDIARWDNKIYRPMQGGIREWELDYTNCSATHIRDIPVLGPGGSNIGVGVGMDMVDANTIVAGSSAGIKIIEIDISSTQGIATTLFTTPYAVAGDIIYMQNTGQILISLANSDLVLYNYNGTVVDSYPHSGGLGMYRDLNGDVFISGYPTNSAVQPVTFNPLIVGSTFQNSGLNISGAAYNSNPNVVCDPPSSGDCYDIGDVGPGGGIIFSVPTAGPGTAGEYYEVGMTNLSYTTETYMNAAQPPYNVCSTHYGGAEWGLNEVPGMLLSLAFGDGQTNTDTIYNLGVSTYHSNLAINPGGDAACPNPPCHPTQDTRTIAADLCKQYNGGGLNDWFLPSWGELAVAMWNVGATQTPTNNIANFTTNPPGTSGITINQNPSFYWTSSSINYSQASGPITAVLMSSTTNPWGYYSDLRCATWLVRPVRKFICTLAPPRTPPGIDYTFRYDPIAGGYPWVPGKIGGIISSDTNDPNNTYTNYWLQVDPNAPSFKVGVMGAPIMKMWISLTDVVGNSTMAFQYHDWHITAYDQHEQFLGHWVYESYTLTGCNFNTCARWLHMWLKPGVSQDPEVNLWAPTNTQYHFLTPNLIVSGPLELSHTASPDISNEYVYIHVSQTFSTSSNAGNPTPWPASYGNTANLQNHLGTGNRRTLPGTSVSIDWPYVCLNDHNNPCNGPPNSQWEDCVKWMAEFPPSGFLTTHSTKVGCLGACTPTPLTGGSSSKIAEPDSTGKVKIETCGEEPAIPIVESVENKRLNELRNRNTQAYKGISNEEKNKIIYPPKVSRIEGESSKMLLHKWKPCPPGYFQNSPFPGPPGTSTGGTLPAGCYTSQTIGQMYGLPGISSSLYQLWAQGNAFYDEACNQTGTTILPGQVVWLKNYACWTPENPELPGECGYHNWCLEYLGQQATNQHVELQMTVQPSFFGVYSDCIKCGAVLSTQPGQPIIPTSWDCVQIGDHPKFGFKCVEIQGTNGQYATKQDCIDEPCSQEVPFYPLDPGMPGGGGLTPLTGGTEEI